MKSVEGVGESKDQEMAEEEVEEEAGTPGTIMMTEDTVEEVTGAGEAEIVEEVAEIVGEEVGIVGVVEEETLVAEEETLGAEVAVVVIK